MTQKIRKITKNNNGEQNVSKCELTGLFKVLECDVVYRKKADGRAVFRTHVRDGGSVCSRELRHAWPKKLHKLPTDTSLP